MTRLREQVRLVAENTLLLGRAAVSSVGSHWALGIFSLVAAFGVWIAIQDVDNPRVEGLAPATGGIQVRAVNIPEGFLLDHDLPTVSVRVNAREGELEELQPGDFEATVDMSGVATDGTAETRRVRVESKRRNVDVLAVIASSNGTTTTDLVEVTLIRAVTRDVPVTARILGFPPAGFTVADSRTIEPAIVRITGRDELVQSVASVDLDVDLGGVRDDTFTAEGQLVARTATGNPVDVRLTPASARATFTIEEVFSQRSMAVAPKIVGNPAPGYTIGNISVDPAVVQVTGPKAIVDNLGSPLTLEPIDITGARQRQTATRNIERPPNVVTDRQSVVVVVDILPIDCSDEGETPCGGSTLFVAPAIEDIPPGLIVEPIAASVQVHVSGPLAQLATLKPEDLRAVISLLGAGSGTTQFTAKVTAPAGIRVDSVQPVAITLRAAITP